MRKLLTLVSLITLFQLEAQAGFCVVSLGSGQVDGIASKTSQQISKYKILISEIISKKPNNKDPGYPLKWSCSYGGCITYSAQIVSALKKIQMPVERIEVNVDFKLDRPNLPRIAYHYFVIDRSIPGSEIIIDPTYKQFFRTEISEPDIFVGTRKQLEDLFIRYKDYFKSQNAEDNNRSLDPVGTVEVIYGYGRGEKNERGESARAQKNEPVQRPHSHSAFSSNMG